MGKIGMAYCGDASVFLVQDKATTPDGVQGVVEADLRKLSSEENNNTMVEALMHRA